VAAPSSNFETAKVDAAAAPTLLFLEQRLLLRQHR
jgi:hypothetical protein